MSILWISYYLIAAQLCDKAFHARNDYEFHRWLKVQGYISKRVAKGLTKQTKHSALPGRLQEAIDNHNEGVYSYGEV